MQHRYARGRAIRGSLLAAILVPLAIACAEITTNICCAASATESFRFDLDATGRSRFRVEGINGRVLVVTSTGENFGVRGHKQAGGTDQEDANARLLNLTIQITQTADEFVIESLHPRTDGRPYVVNYVLEVPARMVPEVATVNGDVTIEEMDNGLTVQVQEGAVTLTDIEGSTETDVASGETIATIRIEGDEVIDLATLNGSITLRIPAGTNAQLEAVTDNGNVTLSGLTLTNELITNNVVMGTLGTGEGSIFVNVDNGNITLAGF